MGASISSSAAAIKSLGHTAGKITGNKVPAALSYNSITSN
jgi:hypothetical protein